MIVMHLLFLILLYELHFQKIQYNQILYMCGNIINPMFAVLIFSHQRFEAHELELG